MATPPPPRITGPGWRGAPQVKKITACQNGDYSLRNGEKVKKGAHLWAVAFDSSLWSIWQEVPGGEWTPWYGNSGSVDILDMAAAQQNDGCMQFWHTDLDGQLWINQAHRQVPDGHCHYQPQGPKWNKGRSWNNAPAGLKGLAASAQGGERGAMVWAITEDFSLISCEFTGGLGIDWTKWPNTPENKWTDWQPWPGTAENSKFVEITAARQNGGLVQFWALDTKGQLWSRYQTSRGGDWSPWSPPNWDNAPKLSKIAACEQAGARGQVLWGITEDNILVADYQVGVGTGWSGWSQGRWLNAPPVQEITACLQNNGCVQIWAITLDQILISVSQVSPGGDWGAWSLDLV